MIVSINQPAYLPWLGYFDRIARSDIHIVLDHVQFEKNSFTNRNRVRTQDGSCWLTVPIKTKGKFGSLPICELELADQRWRRKHWATLCQSYNRAAHFGEFESQLRTVYERPWRSFAALVREMTSQQLRWLNISTPLVFSSQMDVAGVKDDLILQLCRSVGADHYLSGPLGRDYLSVHRFLESGIEVSFHDYEHPVYDQVHPGFEPRMAGVDLVFNYGHRSGSFLAQTESIS